ncbi:hypothetical protein [Paenibacillus gorillae]|uniref:hypothetical protein n=1 Tax=Paenibacillus gorillae TaxID=1243662 RepID=UPI0004B67471|nr:hypothetical protein [Paenibacillus gorillae]
MSKLSWLGIILNVLLGLMFPYVLVGGIVLIYGFMSPPTGIQRIEGIAILLVFLLSLIVVNVTVLRKLPTAKERWYRLLIHAMWFIAALIASFIWLRISG